MYAAVATGSSRKSENQFFPSHYKNLEIVIFFLLQWILVRCTCLWREGMPDQLPDCID